MGLPRGTGSRRKGMKVRNIDWLSSQGLQAVSELGEQN